MDVRFSAKFVSSLRKLPPDAKRAVLHALELFQDDPTDPTLGNHALGGAMTGKRAFVVDGDLRIVLTERGNYRDVTLLDVGGHAAVYRR